MKKFNLAFLLTFALVGISIHGATINVGAGESIQTAVDTASSGDTIVLTAPADYDGNITIAGKALRIVSLHRNNHEVTGSITISAVPAGQSVTLKNLSISGPVSATDSSLNLFRCTMGQEVNATNPGNANTQLAVVQSNLSGKLSSTLTRTWIGYSDLRQSYFEGQVEIVGNIFDGENLGGIGIDLNGSSTKANVHNNIIRNFAGSFSNNISYSCIGVHVSGNASTNIQNNSIYNNFDSSSVGTEVFVGVGILVSSTSQTSITSNILFSNYVRDGQKAGVQFVEFGNTNVQAPKQNVKMHYNSFSLNGNNVSLTKGGVEPLFSITDTNANLSKFLTDPAGLMNLHGHWKGGKDAGSPKDADKDHDGSRNDIGPNGGRNYIPNGRTTDKPIPISFTIAPQIVPIGGTITIESTGATVK